MYSNRKVYGNKPNMVTRSMSSVITGQVMSLKEQNSNAKVEQTVYPEISSDGLYGGYRGASSQSKSHGVFPSDQLSGGVDGTRSAQETKAGSRQEASPQMTGISRHMVGDSSPIVADDINHMKLLARKMSPEEIDEMMKTLLVIKGDRGRGAVRAPGSDMPSVGMDSRGKVSGIRSKLDFDMEDDEVANSRGKERSILAGNRTRAGNSSGLEENFFGNKNNSSRLKNKNLISGLE